MAPKRKADLPDDNVPTGRERKKLKTDIARTISVQPVAGSSTQIPNSMKGLPSTLDVEKFVEARAFEIKAMEEAMKSASNNATQRVWQTLPRHLRRRAASHDVRRVPLRLREKALAEMDSMRRKALGRPKRGKKKHITRTQAFLQRQHDKIWLETHIWHAKRMHMENKWCYRLAIEPTEKSFRPSHRASVHGSIIHDASYHYFIELKGSECVLKALLERCCDLQGQGPGAKRFLTGARVCDTHIYKPGSYPFDIIAPATIIWRPASARTATSVPPVSSAAEPAAASDEVIEVSNDHKRKRKGKDKGKGKAKADEASKTADFGPSTRTVWIRSHPAAFEEVFAAIQIAASQTLDVMKRNRTEDGDLEIEIADLRGDLNIFDIVGPKSSQVIKGALTPASTETREEFKKFWASLSDLQTPGSVPRGMVIGFKVLDPRLNFPPKNAKPKIANRDFSSLNSTPPSFPSSILATCDIWEENVRAGMSKPRFKKKDLDQRRSKYLVPGTPLNPLRQDDRVPVLLIQRSIEGPNRTASSNSESSGLHGWTLIVPKGWGMPFFSSLTYTGNRVGGQRERQTQAFEAGVPYFPHDYPCTLAYQRYAEDTAAAKKARWERKPPAKRPSWDALGTRSPYIPDWDVVLGLRKPDDGLVSTQREPEDSAAPTQGPKDVRPWLLSGSEVAAIVGKASQMLNPSAGLLSAIVGLRNKRGMQNAVDSEVDFNAQDLLRSCLVRVKLTPCGRGAPEDLAAIYGLSDEEAGKWTRMLAKKISLDLGDLEETETPEESELCTFVPNASATIIGYVTNGNFSLTRGRGHAIGMVPLSRLLEMQHQAQRLHGISSSPQLIAKVRDNDGSICRAVYVKLLEG